MLLEVMRKSRGYFVFLQSASRRRAEAALWRAAKEEGLAQSKTLRVFQKSSCRAQRLGVSTLRSTATPVLRSSPATEDGEDGRRPSAAFSSGTGAGLLAFACLLSGCVSQRFQPATPVVVLAGMPAHEAEQTMRQNLASLFPPQYRSVQRALITVAGKQFTCDGVLEVSTNTGWQLAIVSNLGLVAGLRVNRDGTSEVLQVTPLFRESWTRQFVARDVRRLFIPPPEFVSAGRLADGRLVCEPAPESDGAVARYVFSADGQQWQELEVSRAGRREYHAWLRGYRTFAGTTRAVPAEMEVQAESYQLHLHLVELSLKDGIAAEAAR